MRLRKITVHGRPRWQIDCTIAGRRVRESFATRTEAELRRDEIAANQAAAGDSWAVLSGFERRTLADLHHEAARAGVTLSTVWHEWRDLKAGQASDSVGAPILADAVRQFLEVKRRAKLAGGTVKKLELSLGWLVASLVDCKVSAVTHSDALRLLESKPGGSWNTIAATLSGFFAWVVRQGWRPDNPLDRIERHRETQGAPSILSLDELRRCLGWLLRHRPGALGWFVLTTFCGLRPEEAQRTTWDAIRLGDGLVIVDAQTTKTRRRRVVYPEPVALAWLRVAQERGAGLPLGAQACRRAKRALASHLGWPQWHKDVTRHSAASYWFAMTQDSTKVSTMLGHSQAILHRRYKALVTQQQGLAFYSMHPKEFDSVNLSR